MGSRSNDTDHGATTIECPSQTRRASPIPWIGMCCRLLQSRFLVRGSRHDTTIRLYSIDDLSQAEFFHLSLHLFCILVRTWQFGNVNSSGEKANVDATRFLGENVFICSACGARSCLCRVRVMFLPAPCGAKPRFVGVVLPFTTKMGCPIFSGINRSPSCESDINELSKGVAPLAWINRSPPGSP